MSVTEQFDSGVAHREADGHNAQRPGRDGVGHQVRADRGVARPAAQDQCTPPGGPRPFGSRAGAQQLLIDEAEATVLRDAADRVLAGDSLRSIAADMTADGVVGTSGKLITRETLRQMLLNPTMAAGRRLKDGSVIDCESDDWPAIISFETWVEMCDLLMDRGRRSGPGNKPRWLLSGIATCGRDGSKMGVTGHVSGRRYVCPKCHLSIDVAQTDAVVEYDLLALIDAKAWRRLRKGRPMAEPDTAGFDEAMTQLQARWRDGEIDGTQLDALAEELRRHHEAVVADARAVVLPDVPDLVTAWPKLPLEQRRIILQAVTESLVIEPWTKTHGFDPSRIVWKSA